LILHYIILHSIFIALSFLVFQLKSEKRNLTWKELLSRRSDKRVYIELWTSKLVGFKDKKTQEKKSRDNDLDELRELYVKIHDQVRCYMLIHIIS
jgi:hypothetical protein